MTKRTGNLIASIAEPDNLRLAYWKAKRGKDAKPEIVDFGKHLDENLLTIRNGLLQGDLELGNYHYFKIYDPKERLICAAPFPERVMHHAVMNVCHPCFERFQVFDSYATRQGKGQYAALGRAKYFNGKYYWFCKLDIRKYFDSVSHETLKGKLRSRFKDRQLIQLFNRIIDSYQVNEGYGIPIGNLTSQYFANFYLGFADHHLKERIGIDGYVRYMDDMVLWGNNKSELLSKVNSFIDYINKELLLTVKPICLNTVENGLPFLGYTLFCKGVRLNGSSKKRFICKLKIYDSKMESGYWSQGEYVNHVEPLFAFVQYANTHAFRRSLLCKLETG